ncbi:ATP-dependent zinc metalloprotease FtsH [Gossypium australe]|uniref:ATP-dependent zinc metalloprotease FtsH n=1 Tax=Gossypium australe TaxID=47621 RepID=A0A5B6WEZ6_9ROSI|nr:ATP-dependent zinc metalloprotease FtsH [Gossypium australe]
MDDLDCTAEEKLKGVVSLLRDEAYQWWLTVRDGTAVDLAEYKAKFLRLSRYAQGIVSTDHEHGLRDKLRVLIAPQQEREFDVLVEKAKIAEEVKRSGRQNQDRDKGRNKRNFGSSGSAGNFQKRPRFDGTSRVARPAAVDRPQQCATCRKFHSREC